MDFTNRARFNHFRKAMRWTWKNIEAITNLKHARTNLSRKVPAWTLLAVEANERYVSVIQTHLMQLLHTYLGREWSCQATGVGFRFVRYNETAQWLEFIYPNTIYQTEGFLVMDASFIIESNTVKIHEVVQHLGLLYTVGELTGPDAKGEYKATMTLNFPEVPKADREAIAKYFRSKIRL